jgi:hypothetical protein
MCSSFVLLSPAAGLPRALVRGSGGEEFLIFVIENHLFSLWSKIKVE